MACCIASCAHIPPLIIYRGIRLRVSFGDDLPLDVAFKIQKATTLIWRLVQLQKNSALINSLLILDGDVSH
jgi:hypothetical protein